MTNQNNPRRLAVETLTKVQQGAYSSLQLNQIIEQSNLDARDVNLLTNIFYGVLQHQMTLDYQLAPFIKDKKRIQPWVQVLLRTALYQMQYLDRVPNRAIFNESITIAKQMGHDGIRKMVTGVLHAIDRNGVRDPQAIKDTKTRLAIQYSVPDWIVAQLVEQLGLAKCESILASLNQPAKQSIRVNTALVKKQSLSDRLKAAGFEVHPSRLAADGLVLSGHPANAAPGFQSGEFTIQDESAMLPVETMKFARAQVVLDACAAPGGKTTQIVERLKQTGAGGHVVALDLHASRLKQVAKNAQRMQLGKLVETTPLDARKVSDVFNAQTFDQVLVDAPCSGLGLMRRKPEIRYEKTPADIDHLAQVQLAILDAVAPTLKVGGQLTYSTCTILEQENHAVLTEFLARHPEFKRQAIQLKAVAAPDGELRIYPDDFDSDGFFVANLVKTEA